MRGCCGCCSVFGLRCLVFGVRCPVGGCNASCQSVACCILNEYFMATFRLAAPRLKLCNAMHCHQQQAQCVSHFNGPMPSRESKTSSRRDWDWDWAGDRELGRSGMEMKMAVGVRMAASGFLWPMCTIMEYIFEKFMDATLDDGMRLDGSALKLKVLRVRLGNTTSIVF